MTGPVRSRMASPWLKLLVVLVPVLIVAGTAYVVFGNTGKPAPASAADPAASATTPVRARVPDRALWSGVAEAGEPGPWAPIAAFGQQTGFPPRLVLYYSGWRQPFATAFGETAWRHGAILLDQMQPWGAPLAQVAAGDDDGYLRSYAAQVRAFGHPVVIGFGHEMNGTWYPWSDQPPSVFVAAWRHVVTVFRQQGADNVTWMWTIHHTGRASVLRKWWPGSAYVTWVGIDGYMETPHNTFKTVLAPAVRAVRKLTRRPIMLSEVAVGPLAGRMRAKVAGIFRGVRREHLLGLVWFDIRQNQPPYHQDWHLADNPGALTAYQAAMTITRRACARSHQQAQC